MLKATTLLLLALMLLAPAHPALAYIGPGAGISVVGSLLGILATFLVAIGAILFWPLRKLMKRRKAQAVGESKEDNFKRDDSQG